MTKRPDYSAGHPEDEKPSVHFYRCGCRCNGCKKAVREYQRQYKERLRENPREPVQHGTWSGYNNFSCRCEECVAVAKEYRATHKQKKPKNPFAKAITREKTDE